MQAIENHNVYKPPELDLKQREVVNALKHIETEEYPLSQWYEGALYTLGNHDNPDRVAQAAHSLRELIEKLPRVIHGSNIQETRHNFTEMRNNINNRLEKDKKRYSNGWKNENINTHFDKTLRQIVTYFELNQQPSRREQIQQAVVTIDPMINSLDSGVRERKLNQLYRLWQRLEGFVHHKSNPNLEEFSNCLNELESIVFDLLAPITAQDQQEIQTILDYPNKSENNLDRVFSLIERRGSNFEFFFKEISENADATWLPFLKKRGYFSNPPNIQKSDDDSIIYPFWWAIRYLEKISCQVSNEVIEIVRKLPETDNPRVYEGILAIALQVHGEHSVILKPKMLEYVLLKHHNLPHRFADLLAHWTKVNQPSAALELAEKLIPFSPDPQSEEKRKQRVDCGDDWHEMIGTTLYPAPKYNHWEYSNIMSKGIRPIAEKDPYEVACLLIDTTVNMIRLRIHQGELDKEEDYSDAWCKRVYGQDNNHEDPEDTLIHTLTYACKKVFESTPDKVAALDKALRKPHWNIFKRLRHHLYAKYPNKETKPWIRELILTHNDYGLWEHHYEFQQMIRRACEHFKEKVLSEAERTRIFDTILDGPSKENQRHWVEDWIGEEFTEERFQERQQRFHWMQLRPFESVLFGKYESHFKELQDKFNKPISDEDYPPYKNEVNSGWVSERSPRTWEELSDLTDKELLNFINKWEKSDEYVKDNSFVRIDFEGLANAFQTVFRETVIPNPIRLKFWMENRDQIERPIYVRMMIYAMEAQVKKKNFDQLNEWLRFCEWVLSHPDREHNTDYLQGDESRENKNWTNSRRAVGDFIGVCLEKDIDAPITVREQLSQILKTLCTQYDWNLDEKHLNGLYYQKPLTEGINNTRSRALEDFFKYGFWLRRHEPKSEIPELTSLLEDRFSSKTDFPMTQPEFAILGKNFLSIYNFNKNWTIAHKSDFFPQEQSKRQEWYAAISSFILCNGANKEIFEILKADFDFALRHLSDIQKQDDLIARHPIDVFGERLFNYYLWEMFPLNGQESLLEKFYLQTDHKREHWANLFKDIGHKLSRTGKHLDQTMIDGVMRFFEWRFKQGEPKELRYFTYWLNAECMDPKWRLNSYSKVIDICKGEVENWEIYSNLKELCQMLTEHTAEVVECFVKLTEGIQKNNIYIQPEEAETILKTGLNSKDPVVSENAERALENLLRAGRSEFLKLAHGTDKQTLGR